MTGGKLQGQVPLYLYQVPEQPVHKSSAHHRLSSGMRRFYPSQKYNRLQQNSGTALSGEHAEAGYIFQAKKTFAF